jgi:hypothetical protein
MTSTAIRLCPPSVGRLLDRLTARQLFQVRHHQVAIDRIGVIEVDLPALVEREVREVLVVAILSRNAASTSIARWIARATVVLPEPDPPTTPMISGRVPPRVLILSEANALALSEANVRAFAQSKDPGS